MRSTSDIFTHASGFEIKLDVGRVRQVIDLVGLRRTGAGNDAVDELAV